MHAVRMFFLTKWIPNHSAVALERIWKWETPVRRKALEFFFGRALQFLALKVQVVVLVSVFVMVNRVWPVSCLLYFYSRCLRAILRNDLYCVGWGVKLYSLTHPCGPAICKSGGEHVPPPPCTMESAPLPQWNELWLRRH